jgi:hypothetical protein
MLNIPIVSSKTLRPFSIFIALCITSHITEAQDTPSLLSPILQCSANYQNVVSLQYGASFIDEITPEYKAFRGITDHRRDKITRTLLFTAKGSQSYWEIYTTLADGAREQHVIGAKSDSFLQIMHVDRSKILIITKNVNGVPPDNALQGSNPVFDPFSFLLQNSSADDMCQIGISDLTSQKLWKDFQKNVTDIKPKTENGVDYIVVSMTTPTYKEVISFRKDWSYLPQKFSRYDLDGHLRATNEITEILPVSLAGQTILIPKKSTYTKYFYIPELPDSIKSTVSTQTLASIKINSQIDDSIFTIDPSLASEILDEDAKTVIQIPK